MSDYRQFIFENYAFDADAKTLKLHYALDDATHFTETFRFDFEFVEYNASVLGRACQALFYMAGVSYYKAYLPPEIVVKHGELGQEDAAFFSETYRKGLGEFFYVNQLDPRTPVAFPATGESPAVLGGSNEGLLVGIGGGKDSLVSAELLRSQPKVATWSVGHRPQLEPLVEHIGLPHYWVEREWDRQLLALNDQGAYNGHVPISAILACVGTVVAVLSGYRDVVVSNENSANEETLQYQGVAINHQYSKSIFFERTFQGHLQRQFGESLRYFSFLRPLSEIRIAELFAVQGFDKYRDVFSSCNRAFTHNSTQIFWDGTCPKCAFVFLALTPFVERQKLEALFGGKNLLLDPELETTYKQLLGIAGDKPLECVGEVKESRAAMRLAQQKYPELAKYQFELPEDYDFRTLYAHSMPLELYETIKNI